MKTTEIKMEDIFKATQSIKENYFGEEIYEDEFVKIHTILGKPNIINLKYKAAKLIGYLIDKDRFKYTSMSLWGIPIIIDDNLKKGEFYFKKI